MKNVSCEIIQDILPLYHDHVCSAASSAMVEEHLKDCAACTRVLAEMDDDKIEADLLFETHDILKRHEKKERSWQYIKKGLYTVLEKDKRVRRDAFNEQFTRVKFVDVIFSMMLAFMLQQAYDSSVVVEIVRRSIYD